MANDKIIKFVDLFAGIGGFRIGLEQACIENGIKSKCVFSSEIKDHALKVYNHNFREDNKPLDITKIKTTDIPDFDLLLAGFPCQPFSSAGKRNGFLDTRGTLFFDIERILRDKKPFGFILENVDGLLTHNRNDDAIIGDTLQIIIQKLKNLHYQVNYKILNSCHFGLPQDRKRIFIVGTKEKIISLDNFNNSEKKLKEILEQGKETISSDFTDNLLLRYSLRELYGRSIKDKRGGKNNIHSWDIDLKGKITKEQKDLMNTLMKKRRYKKWAMIKDIDWMDGMPLTYDEIKTFYEHDQLKYLLDDLVKKRYLKLEHPKKKITLVNGNGETITSRVTDTTKEKGYNIVSGKLSFPISKILDPEGISPTLVATDLSRIGIVDNNGIRQITIREGLRLFGFPENFKINVPKNEAYDLLGNTVAVPVVKEIAKRTINEFK